MEDRFPSGARPRFISRRRAAFQGLAIALIASIAGPPSVALGQDPKCVASALWSSAVAVEVVDDVAIALFTAGMATFNVSDPAAPVLLERISSLDAPASMAAIEIVGDRAYISSALEGLLVYDVSTPAHPVRIGAHTVQGQASEIEIVGDRLYVAAGYEGGVQIFDLTDPDEPAYLGGCATAGGCFALAIWGQYAYCADGLEGISIVDVADPAHPFLVSTIIGTSYPPYAVEARDGFLYSLGSCGEKGARGRRVEAVLGAADAAGVDASPTAARGDRSIWDPSGMAIHDLAEPLHPTLRGTYHSSEGANRLVIRNHLVYIANADGSVTTVDASDPDAPVEIFETEIGGYAMGIRLRDGRLYVAAALGAFAILGLDNPSAPQLLGGWWESSATNDVRIRDGVAYVVDSYYGLHTVDLHSPGEPAVLADLPMAGRPRAIVLTGSIASIAADSAGVFTVDVSDPEHPQLMGQVAQYAVSIDTDGRYLYTVARNQGMRVIDALDPYHLELVAICPVPGWPSSVSVAGGRACVTNGTDLYVIDVENPRDPQIRGRFDPPEHIRHVTCDGSWAYVCAGNDGLLVVDLSDPGAPVQVADLRFDGNTWGTALHGSRLYVPTGGLQVLDVSNPRHPQIVGSSPMGHGLRVSVDGAVAVTASGSYLGIFLLDPASGVEELQGPAGGATASETGVELRVANPARGRVEIGVRVDCGSGGRVCARSPVIDLLDASRRRVDRLFEGVAPASGFMLGWNTERLAPGVYHLRASTGAGIVTRKVVVGR